MRAHTRPTCTHFSLSPAPVSGPTRDGRPMKWVSCLGQQLARWPATGGRLPELRKSGGARAKSDTTSAAQQVAPGRPAATSGRSRAPTRGCRRLHLCGGIGAPTTGKERRQCCAGRAGDANYRAERRRAGAIGFVGARGPARLCVGRRAAVSFARIFGPARRAPNLIRPGARAQADRLKREKMKNKLHEGTGGAQRALCRAGQNSITKAARPIAPIVSNRYPS